MEELNSLTGLYFSNSFYEKADEFLQTVEPDTYCMMAIDIEHFHIYNHLHGREEGDKLLVMIAHLLMDYQTEHRGVVGYLGGDNFAIITPYEKEELKKLRHAIRREIRTRNNTAGYPPAYGIYPISETSVPAVNMYDRATVALSYVIGNYTSRCCEYTSEMDSKIEEEIRLISEIQEGMDNDEFTFYIQPQVNISKSQIVGGESLVRWNHGEKGMVSPAIFIPVLEKNGFIADLDMVIWEKVCIWIHNCIEKGLEPVPISINVSRIDIFSIDVPAVLGSLIEKYELSPEMLKVEITESAYAENSDKIIETVQALRDMGFLVMMDDFGSGYSSLNMLKSVPVDVIKMDMRFLEINEQEEEKGVGILESVINMARQMGIPIVVEGVETQMQENLLKRNNCRYTQGFYYYRPMPQDDFEAILSDAEKLDHEGFWYKQNESVHVREFIDANLFNDVVFNNILGPAVFYDIYENQVEITRVNDQYFQLVGASKEEKKDYKQHFWNGVRDDDRVLLSSILQQAYKSPEQWASGHINYLRRDGQPLYVNIKAYFLRERDGHKLFYASLVDVTTTGEQEDTVISRTEYVEDLTEAQKRHINRYYGNIPCAFGVAKVCLDEEGKPCDYDVVFANKILGKLCGGDIDRLRFIVESLFPDKQEELIDAIYRAAYDGDSIEKYVYSKSSNRYLNISFYQYQQGYTCCMIQDVTHSYIFESFSNTIMTAYKEVYFLELLDNYCRMIYPEDESYINRGDYAEMIARHVDCGIVHPDDIPTVRKFFTIANLRKALQNQESISCRYRRCADGIEEWCETVVTVSERKNGVPKTAIMTIRSIESLIRSVGNVRRQRISQVMSAITEGIFVYKNDPEEEICFANPEVLKLFGCDTVEEFVELTGNSFKGMVHPDDLERVEYEIQDQIKQTSRSMDYTIYRIIRKDGEIRWIDDIGHLEKSEDIDKPELFYVFLSDITDTITETQKERYIKQSNSFKK